MKYGIISINDDRVNKTNHLRAVMATRGIEEESIKGIEGIKNLPGDSDPWVANYLTAGEWGVWSSNIDIWHGIVVRDEPLLVFEDDAILQEDFHMDWENYLPTDWDFAAIWVPDNQWVDITYNNYYIDNPYFAKAYNGYGGVAIAYSPKGARKLLGQTWIQGVNEPLDTWLYDQSKKGIFNGYSLKPSKQIVRYEWDQHEATTTVHNTPRLRDL